MSQYSHITHDERISIQTLLSKWFSQSEIASHLWKHRSTISREIRRNWFRYNGWSSPWKSRCIIDGRRKEKWQNQRKLTKDPILRATIIRMLKRKRSPEQIVGRLRKIHGDEWDWVCHETIYQFIYQVRPDLSTHLRHKRSKYRRRHGITERRNKRRAIFDRRCINTRSEVINTRKRVWDWEWDLVEWKRWSGYILTLVDRKTGYLQAAKLETKQSGETKHAITHQLLQLQSRRRLSITFDRWKEFMEYEYIERQLQIPVFFCHPYHSWEKWTNENTNGLLREYFPKWSDFSQITQDDVDRAVKDLNNRPRKRHNYATPSEMLRCCTWG